MQDLNETSGIFSFGNLSASSFNNIKDGSGKRFSESITILLIVFLSFIVLIAVLGNILVFIAFIVDKRLRTQSNFFILNLAICDFFIGLICIPIYTPYTIYRKWMFGRLLCKFASVFDYTMTTASALNVALISYDRYLSVTKAVLYHSKQKSYNQTGLKMAAVWIVSFLLYGPAIILWEIASGENHYNDTTCKNACFSNRYFVVITTIFDFAFPFISITFFHMSIYWSIKQRSQMKRQCSLPYSPENMATNVKPYIIRTNLSSLNSDTKKDLKSPVMNKINIPIITQLVKNRNSHSPQSDNTSKVNINIIKLSRDKNVAKSLAILVCIFAICWAPYSFLKPIHSVFQSINIPDLWLEITGWILWLNSAINPLVYPFCHKNFKKAFIKVFLHLHQK